MRTYRYRKRDGWIGLLLVILTTWLAVSQTSAPGKPSVAERNQPGLYQVSRFTDGDTFTVDMNGQPETIRLIGVDTPETHKPNSPVECYGPAAAAFTKNTIGNQSLRLVSDSKTTDRDRYDRLLRYAYLQDGTFLNQKLIAEGYGFYYPYFPFDKSEDFAATQQAAMQSGKGIWSNCQPEATEGGGYKSNPVGSQ